MIDDDLEAVGADEPFDVPSDSQSSSGGDADNNQDAAPWDLPVGVLLDFARLMNQKVQERRQRSSKRRLSLAEHVTRLLDLNNLGPRRKKSGHQRASTACRYAVVLINREMLHFRVMSHITILMKKRQLPEWCTPCRDVVWSKIHEIHMFKRTVSGLEKEVDAWCWRHRSKGGPEREPEETLNERRQRMREFWEGYHTNFRRVDSLPSVQRPLSRPSSGHSGGSGRRGACSLRRAASDAALPEASVAVKGVRARAPAPTLSRTSSSSSTPDLRRTASRPASAADQRRLASPAMGQSLSPKLAVLKQEPSLLQLPQARAGQDALQTRYQRSHRSKGAVPRPVPQPPSYGDGRTTPMKDYLWECENNGIMPTVLPFITGHSLKLSAWDRVMVDRDLMSVTSVLSGQPCIEEADLEGNTVLSDASLVPFLRALFGELAPSLRRLSLKDCRQAGLETLCAVTSLLTEPEGAQNLRCLDLGGIEIAAHLHPGLCAAIKSHPSLKSVCLAGVGLGIKSRVAKQNLGDLLSSRTVEELDIGWNCFSAEAFQHLGERLVETQKLKYLSIANCSPAADTCGDAPALFFLEMLSNDRALVRLDISMNRINFCGALVVEDTFEVHERLEKLSISQNPLGILGMRSILRLLSRDTAGLLEFDCEGCSRGLLTDTSACEQQVFNETNPGGRYNLDLSRPYHRAFLRMLYKACERFNVAPSAAFADVVYSRPPYEHPAKNSRGVWQVPREGRLKITFSIEMGMEAAMRGMEDAPFADVLGKHYSLMRLRPSFRKVIPMFAQWRSMSGMALEHLVFLDALSKDFCLTYPQIDILSREKPLFSDVVSRLLHCLVGGQCARYLLLMLTPTMGEFVWNLRNISQLLAFNVENPTAHYRLKLENCSDYAVAEQLLLIDRWESNIAKRNSVPPVSQRGDYTRVRNEMYDNHRIHGVSSIAEWRLPTTGLLELDYVSGRRPSGSRELLDQDTFDKILVSLHGSCSKSEEKVWVVRMVSHLITISSMQLRELMGAFYEDWVRAELFVCLVLRVVDIWNEKVFRVRFAGRPDLMKELRHRLGEVSLFPFVQPEQAHFSFDLSVFDERLAASLLIHLAARECDNFRNLRDPKFVKADGTPDRAFETSGVSRSWEDFNRILDSGTFSCSYICSADDVQWEKRVKFLELYGQWKVEVPKDEVMWWSALTEAPEDVLEFMEFLVARYSDIWEAFQKIDGPNGNGLLTLREFEESMSKSLKCHKFRGPNEKQRITNIFRYLDPSGEGEVSKEEWGVLGNLWREMQQSIREFVQFLERIYGGREEDYLDVAWRVFDEDMSGEITEKEWVEIALKQLKYFGPSVIIFRFLDKDDEGTVSLSEFRALDAFRRRKSDRPGEDAEPSEEAPGGA